MEALHYDYPRYRQQLLEGISKTRQLLTVWKWHTYGTCHKKLYKIRRIPRKICADSVKLPCSYPRNYSTTSAERVSPFRGMILPCPQICPYPVNVFVLLRGTCLLCTNMAHKLRRCVVRTYVGVHLPRVRTLPLRGFHPFDYYVQANYPSTALGIQYDDSAVIIHVILRRRLWRFWLCWCP